MTWLLFQTLALMLPAFFIGAALACGLRQMMAPAAKAAMATGMGAPAQPTAVSPLPQYAQRTGQTGMAAAATAGTAVRTASEPVVSRPTPEPVARAAAAPAAAAAPVVIKPSVTATPSLPAPAVNTAPAATAGNRFDETLQPRAVEPPRPAPAPPLAPVPVAPHGQAAAPAAQQSAPRVVEPIARVAPPPPMAAAIERPAAAPSVAPSPAMVAAATTAMAAATAAIASQVGRAAAVTPSLTETASVARAVEPTAVVEPAPSRNVAPTAGAVAAPVVAAVPVATVVAPLQVTPAAALVVPSTRDAIATGVRAPVTTQPLADDLTNISRIDTSLIGRLEMLGVTRYSQIAAWRKSDVETISNSLGFQGRIEQENWIEQAQILAAGGETFYSSRRVKVPATAASPIAAASPTVEGVAEPIRAEPPAAAPIPKVEERAAFANLAAEPRVPSVAPLPVPPGAAMPNAPVASITTSAAAIATAAAAASAAAAGSTAANVTRAAVSAVAAPLAKVADGAAIVDPAKPAMPSAPTLAAVVPAAAAAAAEAVKVAAAPPAEQQLARFNMAPATGGTAAAADGTAAAPPVVSRPAMAPTRDTLQRIGSINGEIERLLAAQGVTRFSQIASWGPTETERFDRLLGSQGRIGRENWVEQAKVLGKGDSTAYSRDFDRRGTELPREAPARPKNITDAIRANTADLSALPVGRPDIGGLRSVRSEAYRAPTEAASSDASVATLKPAVAAGGARVVRSAEIDDLKRIRGIGVLIEKRLNSVGIVTYSQVADWTNDDIDRVSASLDFKGRIERENWVEQARILAAGGQTEFSRRVDRGEVETPRPR